MCTWATPAKKEGTPSLACSSVAAGNCHLDKSLKKNRWLSPKTKQKLSCGGVRWEFRKVI